MNPIFQRIQADHRFVLERLQALRDETTGGAALRARLEDLRETLRRHAEAEDAVLYEALRGHEAADGGHTPRELHDQHEAIDRAVLALLDETPGSAGSPDNAGYVEKLTALEKAIRTHVAMEEREIVPRLVHGLDAAALDRLADAWERRFGRLPAGGGSAMTAGHGDAPPP